MGDSPHPGAKPRDDSGHLLPHLPLPPHPHSGPASPPTPTRHNGWFVLRPQDAGSPRPWLRLCSVTWGRCTRLWPGKGAVFHPLHRPHWRQPPHSPPPAAGEPRGPGAGGMWAPAGGGLVPISHRICQSSQQPWRQSVVVPYPIPMEAPRQKGQGTCPRSHSEQKWDPRLHVFPVPLARLSWGHQCPSNLC